MQLHTDPSAQLPGRGAPRCDVEGDPQQRRLGLRRKRLGQPGRARLAADLGPRAAQGPQPHAPPSLLRLPRALVTAGVERALGAVHLGGGRWRFIVWAPFSPTVGLVLLREGDAEQAVAMAHEHHGYHVATVDGLIPDTRYRFRLEGGEFPDPASLSQPEGVHGPATLVDLPAWEWNDQGWTGPPLEAFVIYELNVGRRPVHTLGLGTGSGV